MDMKIGPELTWSQCDCQGRNYWWSYRHSYRHSCGGGRKQKIRQLQSALSALPSFPRHIRRLFHRYAIPFVSLQVS